MYATMTRLLERLEGHSGIPEVLDWACPVPFFGEIPCSNVATVGINPSNREFVDSSGTELSEAMRRLHTLTSLRLSAWSDASGAHVRDISRSCVRYFSNNPYRQWFDVLDRMLVAGGASYYEAPGMDRSCHIDLVAFATREKWGVLPGVLRRSLVEQGRRTVAELICDSPIQVLVLNGRSVVNEFEAFAQASLTPSTVDDWTLPRTSGRGIRGVAYQGTLTCVGGVSLDREVTVIGYNHNLQSSFGVTGAVMKRIGQRVGEAIAAATAH